jgi:hypothetical protein
MKKTTLRGIAFAAIAGLTLIVRAQDDTDQSQFPTITQQPVDECVPIGATATFSVQATNVDSYQWTFNGVVLDDQTNDTLTVANVGVTNVGFYSASVIYGMEVVPTRSANLNVYIPTLSASTPVAISISNPTSGIAPAGLGGGGVITVFGLPVVHGGGSGSCPGKYSGYVNYIKTASQGWGWSPSTNTMVYTATDTNQTITKVQYVGMYGDNGCDQTTVTVPSPTASPVYRFTIYFPTGTTVPTNAYPITLSGFNP